MRPCKRCGAALENRTIVCPDCSYDHSVPPVAETDRQTQYCLDLEPSPIYRALQDSIEFLVIGGGNFGQVVISILWFAIGLIAFAVTGSLTVLMIALAPTLLLTLFVSLVFLLAWFKYRRNAPPPASHQDLAAPKTGRSNIAE